ncbi:hypothetical protein CK203_054046 [Vitis vinifera]|uniref:Uncharacterized protein n=1 Tax=Vitis vinifera TaxID=29760 RepID=A0A438GIK8_VITVI|nr:hypothetical protein CK203_054046 [Vitis vinifera]
MASYSASLLAAGNPNRMACSKCSPVGDCSRRPYSGSYDREAPSTAQSPLLLFIWFLALDRLSGVFQHELGLACAECCEWAGQLGQPLGGLGSRGRVSGQHFEELRPLAPFLNTWFLRLSMLC